HSWIQQQSIPDHLLIDVADYSHVHDGPGLVLVAREANVYFDRFDGRAGLSYSRKAPLKMSFADRLKFIFRFALEACALLESSIPASRLRLQTERALFQINDRLLAPNTPQTYALIAPELERFLNNLYASEIELHHEADAKK